MRKIIFFSLLGIWIFLSVLSVGYNMIFSLSEVKNWYFLSDTQKREQIFGDVYTFVVFVDKHTEKNMSIFIDTQDGFYFYLTRYYLYPQRIYWSGAIKKEKASPAYLISEKKNSFLSGYLLVNILVQKKTQKTWYLYKKNE